MRAIHWETSISQSHSETSDHSIPPLPQSAIKAKKQKTNPENIGQCMKNFFLWDTTNSTRERIENPLAQVFQATEPEKKETQLLNCESVGYAMWVWWKTNDLIDDQSNGKRILVCDRVSVLTSRHMSETYVDIVVHNTTREKTVSVCSVIIFWPFWHDKPSDGWVKYALWICTTANDIITILDLTSTPPSIFLHQPPTHTRTKWHLSVMGCIK